MKESPTPTMDIKEEAIWTALKAVKAPDTNRDVAALNMVQGVKIQGDSVTLKINLSQVESGKRSMVEAEIKRAIIRVPGVKSINLDGGPKTAPAGPPNPNDALQHIRHVIAVNSAKGGVGKSTVAVNLAAALARSGKRVGLLDADIYGPNVPLMAGAEGAEPTVAVYEMENGQQKEVIEPIIVNNMKVMSMGFLVHSGQPIAWRGPMLNSALRQFLGQVDWGELDYLVVDLPPGTGDVQISLLQMAKVTGIVHVTTPQEVALQDVRRGIAMFAQHNVPVLGIIENMSFFQCPNCGEKTDIFSHGGGKNIGSELGVPLLGVVPLHKEIREAGDAGVPVVLKAPDSEYGRVLIQAAEQLVKIIEAGDRSPFQPMGTPTGSAPAHGH
jgi:ATP-binding protein involved in chromosome partitioning